MERVPSQKSNLDHVDEETLASIGHRIDSWEALKNAGLPLETRLSTMKEKLEAELIAMANSSAPHTEVEQEELQRDLSILNDLDGEDEETITEIADTRIAHFVNERRNFLNII